MKSIGADMRILSKASLGSIAVSMGALALSACGGHGEDAYLMPIDALVAKVSGSEKSYQLPRLGLRDMEQSRYRLRAMSYAGGEIRVQFNTADSGALSKHCSIKIEEIDDEWTRATPSCRHNGDNRSKVSARMSEVHVEAFLDAVLYDREINGERLQTKLGAEVIASMGDIQDGVQEQIAEAREAERRAAGRGTGWGNPPSSSGGNDGW